MKYVSTRGKAPILTFEEAMLTGLARDGGLYLPGTIPQMAHAEIAALEAMGHTVKVSERQWGNMHGVLWNRETGEVTAGSDPRSDAGSAVVK
jgi:threonine synthase